MPDRQNKAIMSEETLRATLRLLFSSMAPEDSVQILWHAGEPLTVGLKFFERASMIIRECNSNGAHVTQLIQTNGTLINKEWCQFFVREKMIVGVSVDGPAIVHDHHRRNFGNRPTHARVMKGIDFLKLHHIPLHAIAVTTPYSLNFADEIFDFFSDEKFETLGFNLEETEGAHASAFHRKKEDIDIFREKYRIFMSRLFERWKHANKKPRIREFENMCSAIHAFLKDNHFYRTADDTIPFRNIVVTREGNISTFSPELASGTTSDPLYFSIGNVHDIHSLDELMMNKKFQTMARGIEKGIARCQSECEYFPICGGGTASNKFYEHGTFDCTETTTCALERKTLLQVVAEGLR